MSMWETATCRILLHRRTVLAAQGVNRSWHGITSRQLGDQLTAAVATGSGVDERACHRLGRPAFVSQQDRQAKVCEVPGEGAARLAPWRFDAVEIEGPAYDDPLHLLSRDEFRQRRLALRDLGAGDGVRRAGVGPASISQGEADGQDRESVGVGKGGYVVV